MHQHPIGRHRALSQQRLQTKAHRIGTQAAPDHRGQERRRHGSQQFPPGAGGNILARQNQLNADNARFPKEGRQGVGNDGTVPQQNVLLGLRRAKALSPPSRRDHHPDALHMHPPNLLDPSHQREVSAVLREDARKPRPVLQFPWRPFTLGAFRALT